MITKKSLAASVLATSLIFSGGVLSAPSISHVSAAQTTNYQTQLNTFSTYYAGILRTLENYSNKLDKAKTEEEAMDIYDQYLTYFEKVLDTDAPTKGYNSEIQLMDQYIYNSLVEMYNFEVDTIDYENGDLSEVDYKKAYQNMTSYVDAQDALFKKAAASYKAKYKVTFGKDMLYLLDQSADSEVPPIQGNTYTVKKGDTLYSISKRNKTTVSTLKKLNNLKSDFIRVGQIIKLPSAPVNTPAPSAAYTVKKGDTLFSIGKKVKLSVAELKKINNLKSDRIYPGQVLKLKK